MANIFRRLTSAKKSLASESAIRNSSSSSSTTNSSSRMTISSPSSFVPSSTSPSSNSTPNPSSSSLLISVINDDTEQPKLLTPTYSKRDPQSECLLLQLPIELQLHIFGFLDTKSYCRLSQACFDIWSLASEFHAEFRVKKLLRIMNRPTWAWEQSARIGDLTALRWLDARKIGGCTPYCADYAAGNGHLEVVKWLYENGKSFTEKGIALAAAKKQLEVLRFLIPRSSHLTKEATSGHLRNLQLFERLLDNKQT